MTYVNEHRSQYDTGNSAVTRSSGCTWTSGANAADAATGGTVDVRPDYVKSLVPKNQETNPSTPGWSLQDLDLAMLRLGVPFLIRSGQGWDAVVSALDDGHYVVLQGDSDQFGSGTCSGNFDGDHAIGVHPRRDNQGRQWIDDPICPEGRWEHRSVLRSYAEKFSPSVRFGVYDVVPGGEMGTALTFPAGVIVSGRLSIPKGTAATRVADGTDYTVASDVTRDAALAQLAEPQSETVYVVDLVGTGTTDTHHWIRRSALPADAFAPYPDGGGDDLAARQAQWDTDAAAAIGPRPK